jgi:biopolymer transport protein TolR
MGAEVGSKTAKSEPNVVPLCDILLVLLIIFMVITPMIQKGANVTLPEAVNTKDQPTAQDILTVFIKRDGTINFDEKNVSDLEKLAVVLMDKLEEEKETTRKLALRADGEIGYGRVVDVIEVIRKSGIEIVGLIVEPKTSIQ